MTKELFLLREKELDMAKHNLLAEYISANEPCAMGEIIKVNGVKGVVTGFKLDWNNNVCPIAMKIKKDGTQSSFALYIFHIEDVTFTSNPTNL
jgi:hypothetical protein